MRHVTESLGLSAARGPHPAGVRDRSLRLGQSVARTIVRAVATSEDLPAQLAAVGTFLDHAPLRTTIAELEIALTGCGPAQAAEVASSHGVTIELLRSAIAARDTFGKVSDLIHAVATALALPHILEAGETLVRPSLAAGNTPNRLYDVETDRRIAEFKLGRWDGNDGGRQQPTVKDLVRLAADSSGRTAELYVRGTRPITWLKTTRSTVRQQLRRYRRELSAFETVFGDPDIAVANFVAHDAAHVRLIDIEEQLPDLFSNV
jgi:hypothetical protein